MWRRSRPALPEVPLKLQLIRGWPPVSACRMCQCPTGMLTGTGAGEHGREPGLAAGSPTAGGKVKVDWKRVGAAGSVIGGIAVMHGLKTRKWRSIHSFGVALGVAATVVPLIERARRMSATYA